MLSQTVDRLENGRSRLDRCIVPRRQPACGNVVIAAAQFVREFAGFDGEVFDAHTEFKRKGFDQVMLEPGRTAGFVRAVGQRAGLDEDDKIVLPGCREGQRCTERQILAAGGKYQQ